MRNVVVTRPWFCVLGGTDMSLAGLKLGMQMRTQTMPSQVSNKAAATRYSVCYNTSYLLIQDLPSTAIRNLTKANFGTKVF